MESPILDGKIHAEEDAEMRTVFVKNVHFAATKEALSKYFSKCGAVENVLILTDKTTGQRKGSAYVAFASKDSVEKAMALSGTTFFSRTLKVSRTSAMAQLAGKPSHAFSRQQESYHQDAAFFQLPSTMEERSGQ